MCKNRVFRIFAGLFFFLALGWPGRSAVQAAPPTNDDFANAAHIEALPFSDTLEIAEATTEPGEPQDCRFKYQTVWYAITPDADISVAASISGSDPFNVQVSIYQAAGPEIGDLTFLGCDPAPYGFLGLKLQAGATYYIQAGTTDFASGSITVSLRQASPPANDDFEAATTIATLPFSEQVDIREAAMELGEPSGCGGILQSVWYAFRPDTTRFISVDAAGSHISARIINVYQSVGPGMQGLAHLGCHTFFSAFTFSAQAGTTYYLQVGRDFTGASGIVQVNLQELTPPSHDDFSNALAIPGLPFVHESDNIAATLELDEPIPSCARSYDPGSTVWYAFTPGSSGPITASFQFSTFSPFMAAYTGGALSSLTEVTCKEFGDPMTLAVDAGITYFFQVGGLFGGFGPMVFQLEDTPPPVAAFSFVPGDPSIFDTVQFFDNSFDPGRVGIEKQEWDFGDGKKASGCCPAHQYAADGNYTVQLKVITVDGRSASTSQLISVATHDVAVTRMIAPKAASAGQTRQIEVHIRNHRYPERVQVELWKSTPVGFELVGFQIQNIPVRSGNRTTKVVFNYTFTAADASIGKVTFKSIVHLLDAREAWPADNQAIAPPTKVN